VRWQLNDLGPTRFGKNVEGVAELAIAIVEDKLGQAVVVDREISQLLNHPPGVRMLRHVD